MQQNELIGLLVHFPFCNLDIDAENVYLYLLLILKIHTYIFCFCRPYGSSIGKMGSSSEFNSNSLTRKGRFNISTENSIMAASIISANSNTPNTNSLTKKGRFRVKRVRSGSQDEGKPDSKEQSPTIISNVNVITTFFTNRPTTPNPK